MIMTVCNNCKREMKGPYYQVIFRPNTVNWQDATYVIKSNDHLCHECAMIVAHQMNLNPYKEDGCDPDAPTKTPPSA